MKSFTKMLAAFVLTGALLPIAFAQSPASAGPPKAAMSKMAGGKTSKGRKGGYVHAHTYTTKTGKTVHVKGHYRHSTKVKGGKKSKM